MTQITLLGTGLIGSFYADALHGNRGRDRIGVVYSRSEERAQEFATKWEVPVSTTDMDAAIGDTSTDVVLIALPNHLHEQAVLAAAKAGKAILCTKPLGRNAAEARRMLEAVEKAGVFHGYLEDLVYTPKTLKSLASVRAGSLGKDSLGSFARSALGATQRLVLGQRTCRRWGRSSTWAAIVSRSHATLLAKTFVLSKSFAGAIRKYTRSTPKTTPSGWSVTRTVRSDSLK